MSSVKDNVYFKAEGRGIAISWEPPPPWYLLTHGLNCYESIVEIDAVVWMRESYLPPIPTQPPKKSKKKKEKNNKTPQNP